MLESSQINAQYNKGFPTVRNLVGTFEEAQCKNFKPINN